MKRTITIMLVFTAFIFSSELYAQDNIQKYVDQMKTDTLFRDAVVGIMVMDSKGNTVAEWNPDMPMLTASTMKTITTGLGLKLLGADFRFTTKIGHTGIIDGGVLYGDLFIVGGGDPTLGSLDTLAFPIEEVYEQWAKAISDAGIVKINGSIVADDRFFKDETIPETWSWSNIGPSYGSAASGLSLCENAQYFKFIPGKNIGDKVVLESVYPEIPEMEYKNMLISSGPYTGDRSSYYVSDLSKIGKFDGSLPCGKDSVIVAVSNKYPSLSCAYEFRKFLTKKGITVNPVVKDAKTYNAPFLFEIKIIGETQSPPLSTIVNVTNRISNNFFAETIFKMIGKKLTGVGSYDSARVAVIKTMKGMGLSTRGYTQVDGCGLSRQDYVSARFFCNYFSKMKESDTFGKFFGSLPQPGGPGTLRTVLSKVELGEKSRIHAKSGSLASVKCYAGYVERKGGEMYTFAILTNNYSARTAQIQVGVEGFMRELVR